MLAAPASWYQLASVLLAGPTIACTLSSISVLAAVIPLAGTPPSSSVMTLTGWPLIPPWLLVHLVQASTVAKVPPIEEA
jgi:hypothetical protein